MLAVLDRTHGAKPRLLFDPPDRKGAKGAPSYTSAVIYRALIVAAFLSLREGGMSKEEAGDAELLRGCYRTSLELAAENDCRSIAFSAISTGIYGYPSAEAAQVALQEVRDFLTGEKGNKIDKVVFCSFEMKDVHAYNEWTP